MPTDYEGKAAGFRAHAKHHLLQMGCEYPVCWVKKDSEAQFQIKWEGVA